MLYRLIAGCVLLGAIIGCSDSGNEQIDERELLVDVTVYGPRETFIVDPNIGIYQKGQKLGTVLGKEKTKIKGVRRNSELTFKYMFRSARCRISESSIILSFDRLSGELNAVPAEDVADTIQIREQKEKDQIKLLEKIPHA